MFLVLAGMTHVLTSLVYPQRTGKLGDGEKPIFAERDNTLEKAWKFSLRLDSPWTECYVQSNLRLGMCPSLLTEQGVCPVQGEPEHRWSGTRLFTGHCFDET